MKVAIIGGGPAGLYAAILLKKQRPQAEITVYERNRADDTFGFGVVFSDATSPRNLLIGMTSPCTSAARCIGSAATAFAAARAGCCC
jgi:uncharacterized NAD(P)/FAD-binding protein YdhS